MKTRLPERIGWFFRSTKLAAVLLSLIAVTCLVGAVVPQSPFPLDQGTGQVSRVATAVRWFFRWRDISRSPILATLLVLLVVSVFARSLRAFRSPSRRSIGWVLAHTCVIVILAGIVAGQLAGDVGMMKLHVGESSGVAERADGTELDLGFRVALDQLAVEYDAKLTEKLVVFHGGVDQVLPITVGQRCRLRDGSSFLRIDDHIPHAAMRTHVGEGEGAEINPAVRIVVEGGGRTTGNWVFAAEEKDTRFFEGAISVRYLWCDTDEAYGAALSDAISPERERLLVHVQGVDIVQALPVEIGKTFPINGTSYAVEMVRYVPDFRRDADTEEPFSASDEPKNPALEVQVTDGERSVNRWVFSRFPDLWNTHSDGKETGLELRYVRPAELTVRLVDLDYSRIALVRVSGEGPAEAESIRVGEQVKLGESGWDLTIAERVVRPVLVREATRSFDPRAEPAIHVTLQQQDGAENSVWLTPNTPEQMGETVLLYSREFEPTQYISDVRFIVDGRVMDRGEVKVNVPLKYGGFEFYQSSYGDDGGLFSVLQVKKDSGAPIVYAAVALLSVGLLYGFYIKRLFGRKEGTV